jgi:hypothetical protein
MNINDLRIKRFSHHTPVTLPKVMLSKSDIEMLLEQNTNNIPPVQSKITLYSELMLKGEWKYNGDSIRISDKGILLDGQNRLLAAQKVGFSIESDIVAGLPEDVFNTIDQGRVRQRGHLLARSLGSSATQSEANNISKAVSKIMKHDMGYSQQTGVGKGTNAKLLITPDDIYKYVENNPNIIDEVTYTKDTFGSRSLVPQSTILYIYHIGCRYDEEYTKKFLKKVFLASGLNEGETLHHLNQVLVRIKSKQTKWSSADIENTLIKVWNSVARSGLYAIKHSNNIKARDGESHVKFNIPSLDTVREMLT